MTTPLPPAAQIIPAAWIIIAVIITAYAIWQTPKRRRRRNKPK